MGMIQRRTRRGAVVLEHDDVAETAILTQILHPFARGPQHLLDRFVTHVGEHVEVARRLDNHLVRADAVHLVENPLALTIERAFDA